jgi:hypothetical protein
MNDDDLAECALAGGAEEERQRQGVERVYRNDQIVVSWEPRRCIHAGSCFRGLPQVFKPRVSLSRFQSARELPHFFS